MSDAVAIALVAAVTALGTLISPIVVTHMGARQRRAERAEDYTRQDAVASRAAAAARLLLDANERVADAANATNVKLDVIHTLVNSSMTASMQAELGATVRELAMMREVVGLKRAAGHEPPPEALSAINATELRVTELRAGVADRVAQTALAENQIETAAPQPTKEVTR